MIEGKQPKPWFGCLARRFFNTPKSYVFTEIKENFAAQKAHNVGPPTACQRYAISMAYPWWAVDGPTLCASWNGDLMTLGRFKRRQYFVSKWFVNLHLTVIFIVPIDVVTCIYM